MITSARGIPDASPMTRQPASQTHRIPLLYIAGEGRSGSTVLEQLLCLDDSFVALGEVRHLWHRGYIGNWLCGCGVPFTRCAFWTAVDDAAFGRLDQDGARRLHALQRHLAAPHQLPEILSATPSRPSQRATPLRTYLNALRAVYAAALAVSNKTIVIDSSKDGMHGFLVSRVPGVALHVVHLVRDARAVAYSWAKRKVRVEITKPDVVYMPRFSPWRTAIKWSYRNLTASCLQYVADSYCRIRYEDFVGNPAAAIAEIRRHAGLTPLTHGIPVEQPIPIPPVHSISGNPDRVGRTSVTLRMDDEWTTSMRPIAQAQVTAIAAPLMWKYGFFARASRATPPR